MFYLMLILLLYRFYSNCDLTECNPSVVPAIYWHVYIYIYMIIIIIISTQTYYFPYVRQHRFRYHLKITVPSWGFFKHWIVLISKTKNMLATNNILSDQWNALCIECLPNLRDIITQMYKKYKKNPNRSVLKKKNKTERGTLPDNAKRERERETIRHSTVWKGLFLPHSMEGKLHNGEKKACKKI